jgi:hypothetical protein
MEFGKEIGERGFFIKLSVGMLWSISYSPLLFFIFFALATSK